MDIKMPEMDGISATKLSREFYPYTEIIALTMYSEKEYFLQMMYAGAKGFLLKDCASHEFENAINAVSVGNNYYPKGLASEILFNNKLNQN
jgi:DNA-binding NarL/FixJ family response regulator